MNKIIFSIEELQNFYEEVLPPLNKSEFYFVSLSARNKYLTQEERQDLLLGRTEMFERRIIRERDFNKFLRTIRKFECNDGAFITKNNKNIPGKCIVCYININPSCIFKTYKEFNATINEYLFEFSKCLEGGKSVNDVINRIKKMDILFLNCAQKARSTKHYIDIDYDVEKNDNYIYEINKFLADAGVNRYFWIETKNGYHLLIKTKDIRFDPQNIIKFSLEKFVEKKEIKMNNNGMIPLPGTLQGCFPVKIIDKKI